MATNRASSSDPVGTTPRAEMHRDVATGVSDPDTPRRAGMVIGGAVLAVVSLIVGSLGISQVWLAPAAANGSAAQPFLQSWEAMVMALLGGVGLAAGGALVGIGMGRWTAPRPSVGNADYTGPGTAAERHDPHRVV